MGTMSRQEQKSRGRINQHAPSNIFSEVTDLLQDLNSFSSSVDRHQIPKELW